MQSDFSLDLPEDFGNYAREVEAKGWFADARLTVSGKQYRLNFYDPGRLQQETEDSVTGAHMFFEPNLVVVPSVTRSNMERAVQLLVQSGHVASLVQEI